MYYRKRPKLTPWLMAFLIIFSLKACSVIKHNGGFNLSTNSASSSSISATSNQSVDQSSLANLDFKSGDSPVVEVNQNQSTLNINDWQTDHVDFANLDNLNRTSGVTTAYLNSQNATNASLRSEQTVQPTGWHNNHGRTQIYNRGHLVAYSISKGIDSDGNYQANLASGDQNNLKNLFTQTAYANQSIQTIYEQKVRTALYQGQKVIYQAQPIFRGNELMARGIHLQAISSNGDVNFNVYIYNVQPGYRFNYATGKVTKDKSLTVTDPANAVHFNNN